MRRLKKKLNLNQQRLGTVVAVLKSVNAKKVIDLGCGEGNLLSLLLKDKSLNKLRVLMFRTVFLNGPRTG